MIDERTGCAALKERFIAAGFSIVEDHPLLVAGKRILLDGFDPERKVGFEYLTTEAGDREEMTPEVLAELESRMALGELYILLIDEREVESADVLRRAADHFLRVVSLRLQGSAGGPARPSPAGTR